MTRRAAIAVACASVCLSASTAAYLKLGVPVGGRLIGLQWDRTIDYFVTNRDVDGVTAVQMQAAVDRAFATWEAVPRVSLAHQFIGFTGAEPVGGDGISVVGFRSRPELDRTLAAAMFEVDESNGRIVEVDIFFNSEVAWSVAQGGQSARFDLESVGLHEVGHLLGLGHSALGETTIQSDGGRRVTAKRAVMFPIAYPAGNIEDRTLEADDRAAITDVYGTANAARETGGINGRVTLNGAGIFGAHVTAMHTGTGELISAFSLTANGEFAMAGLPPGLYAVRAEPLDDADLESFFDNDSGITIDFSPAFHTRLVAVPKGGSGPAIEIKVKAK